MYAGYVISSAPATSPSQTGSMWSKARPMASAPVTWAMTMTAMPASPVATADQTIGLLASVDRTLRPYPSDVSVAEVSIAAPYRTSPPASGTALDEALLPLEDGPQRVLDRLRGGEHRGRFVAAMG